MPCYSSYSNNNAHCSYMGPLRSPYTRAAAGYAKCSNMGPLYYNGGHNNGGNNCLINNGGNNGLINNGGNNGPPNNGMVNGPPNNGMINGPPNNGIVGEIINGVDALARGRFSRYR